MQPKSKKLIDQELTKYTIQNPFISSEYRLQFLNVQMIQGGRHPFADADSNAERKALQHRLEHKVSVC